MAGSKTQLEKLAALKLSPAALFMSSQEGKRAEFNVKYIAPYSPNFRFSHSSQGCGDDNLTMTECLHTSRIKHGTDGNSLCHSALKGAMI